MKTKKKHASFFLVLVPHGNIRFLLRNYSDILFKAGYSGAYHFPWTAPLAAISRPFDTNELKHCAYSLRKAAGKGKIFAKEAQDVDFQDKSLFGPRINLEIPHGTFNTNTEKKIKSYFSPTVIGACLLSKEEIKSSFKKNDIPPPPPGLSFRAAAVANMYWQPLHSAQLHCKTSTIGYKWKIGKLIWLPVN